MCQKDQMWPHMGFLDTCKGGGILILLHIEKKGPQQGAKNKIPTTFILRMNHLGSFKKR